MKTRILLLSILVVILVSPVQGTITCSERPACLGDETFILGLSDSENTGKHASTASLSNNLCCKSDVATLTTSTTCANPILNLLQTLDSHLEKGTLSNYNNNICINAGGDPIDCVFSNLCLSGSNSIFQLSSDTDAHISATPGTFNLRACCKEGCTCSPAQDQQCQIPENGLICNGCSYVPATKPPMSSPNIYQDYITQNILPIQPSAGGFYTCVILSDGKINCFGANDDGAVGDGTGVNQPSPVEVTGITNAKMIDAGFRHACAVLADGRVFCWGKNNKGQVGDGTTIKRLEPQFQVQGISNAISVSGNGFDGHTCALLEGGSIKCWGFNDNGQLGDNSRTDRLTPVPVIDISDARVISTGSKFSCAVLSTGLVECWGDNGLAQLGDNTRTDRLVPTKVSGITNALSVSSGGDHTCALLTDGRIKCWGGNHFNGEHGDDTTDFTEVPVDVLDIANAIAIDSGTSHTCALISDGTIKCWGDNARGQIGDGTNGNDRLKAVNVNGITNAVAITTGGSHTCALLVDGTLKCWGYGNSFQLGDGDFKDQNEPVIAAPNNPLALETCDSKDNDCNGLIDDGNLCDPGDVCKSGVCGPDCACNDLTSCDGNTGRKCNGCQFAPTTDVETCDGLDNNCNGAIDEGFDGDDSTGCCTAKGGAWNFDINKCCGDPPENDGKEFQGSGNNFWKCENKKWINLNDPNSLAGLIIFTSGDDYDTVVDTQERFWTCDIDNNQPSLLKLTPLEPISVLGHDYICYDNTQTAIETIAECDGINNEFFSEEGLGGERHATGSVINANPDDYNCCSNFWDIDLDSSACLNTCTEECSAGNTCNNKCEADNFCNIDPDCGKGSCTKNCAKDGNCNFLCFSDNLCGIDPDCASNACEPAGFQVIGNECCGDDGNNENIIPDKDGTLACCDQAGTCVIDGICTGDTEAQSIFSITQFGTPTSDENTQLLCTNENDDDCDGLIDGADPHCAGQKDPTGAKFCQGPNDCTGLDPGNCGSTPTCVNNVCTTLETPSQCTDLGECGTPKASCRQGTADGLKNSWICDYTADDSKCNDCNKYCDATTHAQIIIDTNCRLTSLLAQETGGVTCYLTYSDCVTAEDSSSVCPAGTQGPQCPCPCNQFTTDCITTDQQASQDLGGDKCV